MASPSVGVTPGKVVAVPLIFFLDVSALFFWSASRRSFWGCLRFSRPHLSFHSQQANSSRWVLSHVSLLLLLFEMSSDLVCPVFQYHTCLGFFPWSNNPGTKGAFHWCLFCFPLILTLYRVTSSRLTSSINSRTIRWTWQLLL